jgi:hypothetical protein
VRDFFELDPCVVEHEHLGTHDGQEAGFVCTVHQDGIMGAHPKHSKGIPTYPKPPIPAPRSLTSN